LIGGTSSIWMRFDSMGLKSIQSKFKQFKKYVIYIKKIWLKQIKILNPFLIM